ncbi:oryzin precursor [Stemphylium lycopersici]|uniref:Oryzin n=1 Tax=Stemphylium lycopersici TaxID=183478 RepID=A0A364N1T8_STELY|nr:oryzin precursor [Stemphylium lycopersici]RAR00900.1 oryzin precursor [Stemphylium lycopersici]RAR08972.1 oryzin precursor [Stemphylium lycopersici]
MELAQQFNATWGLARISHAKPNDTTYLYDSSAGSGTCVSTDSLSSYVIDTGIDITHPEFQGRASFLADYSGEDTSIDGDGHGTHVAGIIGSATWGVAKNTILFAVRVLDSSGFGETSGVLAGMQFVINDAKQRQEKGQCPSGVVANMSLGGEKLQSINDAAAAIVAAGIFLGVAAGNDATPVDYWSPSSEPSVCTVGATAANDTLIEWSNYGPLVDILAPGVDITSTFPGGRIRTYSGTSMAAPHVVGLAAYMLGLGAPLGGLCETLAAQATKGTIDENTLPKGTQNLLAFNGADASRLYGRRRIRV